MLLNNAFVGVYALGNNKVNVVSCPLRPEQLLGSEAAHLISGKKYGPPTEVPPQFLRVHPPRNARNPRHGRNNTLVRPIGFPELQRFGLDVRLHAGNDALNVRNLQ
jgi:hypothetical protein